jgi:hypothetical protein
MRDGPILKRGTHFLSKSICAQDGLDEELIKTNTGVILVTGLASPRTWRAAVNSLMLVKISCRKRICCSSGLCCSGASGNVQ